MKATTQKDQRAATQATSRERAVRVVKQAVIAGGCRLNRWFDTDRGQRAGILMYHRIAEPPPGVDEPTFNVSPAVFRQQIEGLLERGYQPWSLRRLVQQRDQMPANCKIFVLTFDDGHESVYRGAWPILRELQVPATIFLPTAYIDSGRRFPFDDWSMAGSDQVPAETWRPMTIEQCREVAADGLIELAAHTHTHRDLSHDAEEFFDDMQRNVEALRLTFGIEQPTFSYPFGRHTPEMMAAARRSGVSCALTTEGRIVDFRASPFGWGRINVDPWDTADTIAIRMTAWYARASQWRRRVAPPATGTNFFRNDERPEYAVKESYSAITS